MGVVATGTLPRLTQLEGDVIKQAARNLVDDMLEFADEDDPRIDEVNAVAVAHYLMGPLVAKYGANVLADIARSIDEEQKRLTQEHIDEIVEQNRER